MKRIFVVNIYSYVGGHLQIDTYVNFHETAKEAEIEAFTNFKDMFPEISNPTILSAGKVSDCLVRQACEELDASKFFRGVNKNA